MGAQDSILVTTFYKFARLTEADQTRIRSDLELLGTDLNVMGLVILGAEGVNTTMSIPSVHEDAFKARVTALLGIGELRFKDSFAPKHPFHELKVKVRSEIVTLKRPDLFPQGKRRHLSPDEWNQVLKNEDVVLIDTRNSFEYDLGHFKGAVNPKTEEFSEFPDYVRKAGIPKDKKVLIYCTGGIRCEKAILEMEEQGYDNVYQLDGGILNYLEAHPDDQYEGECFVFDYRVAVDQRLQPTSQYRLCPHCGEPGKAKIECIQCGVEAIVCEPCLEKSQEFETCSKNCHHHFRMGHKSGRIHEDGLRKRGL